MNKSDSQKMNKWKEVQIDEQNENQSQKSKEELSILQNQEKQEQMVEDPIDFRKKLMKKRLSKKMKSFHDQLR